MQSACAVDIFTEAFVTVGLNWGTDWVAASDSAAASTHLLLTIWPITEWLYCLRLEKDLTAQIIVTSFSVSVLGIGSLQVLGYRPYVWYRPTPSYDAPLRIEKEIPISRKSNIRSLVSLMRQNAPRVLHFLIFQLTTAKDVTIWSHMQTALFHHMQKDIQLTAKLLMPPSYKIKKTWNIFELVLLQKKLMLS
jgi:hypothetical protein